MTHVLITVDTELSLMMQLQGRSAADNLKSAIEGLTPAGGFGIPHQLDMLDRYDLKGVFFVEALHTQVVGGEQLRRIVDMIGSRGHEVQLHCHVEWLWFHPGAMRQPRSRHHLSHYSEDEQVELLGLAKSALEAAGAPPPTAFRAGNYGASDETLRALKRLGIGIDSSFDRGAAGRACRIGLPLELTKPVLREGIVEVPVSWFYELGDRTRRAQLCAVSSSEFENAMRQAARHGHPCFNIVSHSFELLNRQRTQPQSIVVRRFERLCRFLAENRATLPTAGFNDLDWPALIEAPAAPPIRSHPVRTGLRMAEQALGNFLYERKAN